jgi:hypothetical protein
MSQATPTLPAPADSPAGVLAAARAARAAADREEARVLALAVEWAAMHSVDSLGKAASWSESSFGDRAVPIAGPGAPLVAEFSVAELAAALGLPTEVGKSLLGEAVELRHRLPRVWARVQGGDLPAWRARRIARATICLDREAATFVDERVASFAHRVGPAVVDRLVEEAVVRFMPDDAEARRRAAADRRHVTVHDRQVSFEGTVSVEAELDLADALDLDTALRDRAAALASLGSTDSLDVRRSVALGELARGQRVLELQAGTVPEPRDRELVLYVHLSDDAVTGRGDAPSLARVANTRSFVTAEQVRSWCSAPDARITVRPVIDLRESIRVDAYEVPERLAEQVVLRDGTCVFPWCTRSARACDLDHVEPYVDGGAGQTSSDNLAPLCRRHHRLKTFGGWRYRTLHAGAFIWTSPHGQTYLRDHLGTTTTSAAERAREP